MKKHSRPYRSGFTVFDLIVVLVILAFLIGLLLPIVQMIRQAAARMESANNIKQIVLSLHSCNDAHKKLPPPVGFYPMSARNASVAGNLEKQRPAWHGTLFYHILPFMEQDNVYRNTVGSSWTSTGTVVKTFIAPLDTTAPATGLHHQNRGAVSYGINVYALMLRTNVVDHGYDALGYADGPRLGHNDSQMSIPKIAAMDGTSNTIAIAERFAACSTPVLDSAGKVKSWRTFERTWGESSQYYNNLSPAVFRPLVAWGPARVPPELMPEFGVDIKSCEPATWQALDGKVVQVGLWDGSVRGITSSITHSTWSNVLRPDSGIVLGPDW